MPAFGSLMKLRTRRMVMDKHRVIQGDSGLVCIVKFSHQCCLGRMAGFTAQHHVNALRV